MSTQTMQTSLPYAGSSGWSGTDTSQERALMADTDGSTASRQWQAMSFLAQRGLYGATWRELAEQTNEHHGAVSGVLSVLHKEERISRLLQKRDRCRVYVLPEFVNGRDTDTQGRKTPDCPHCGGAL